MFFSDFYREVKLLAYGKNNNLNLVITFEISHVQTSFKYTVSKLAIPSIYKWQRLDLF